MIQDALTRLEQEIARVPAERKVAYTDAVKAFHSKMVLDSEVRLKFLRAEVFDVPKATRRFVEYWDLVRKYYGDVALTRPLLFEDLGPEEMEIVRNGNIQLVGTRDRFGRRILSIVGDLRAGYHYRHSVRLAMYLIGTACAEDLETQRKGIVSCVWPEGTNSLILSDPTERKAVRHMLDCVPLRVSAAHICLPTEPKSQLLLALLLLALPKAERARTRMHLGNPTECRYKLMTFGVPVRDLPLTDSGRLKNKYLTSWIKTRQAKDKAFKEGRTFQGIEVPLRSDVLFCNGGQKFFNPGNTAFRDILEERREEYCIAKNHEKRPIISSIIHQVGVMNGRFLLWDAENGWWEELPLDSPKLMDRVATALRDHYKRLKEREMHEQTSRSSTSGFLDERGQKRKFGCFAPMSMSGL